jgi:hypothetical protein
MAVGSIAKEMLTARADDSAHEQLKATSRRADERGAIPVIHPSSVLKLAATRADSEAKIRLDSARVKATGA